MPKSPALRIPRQQPAKRLVPERRRDFGETDQGLTPMQAFREAERCLQCSTPPCAVMGCPLGNDIPRWIDHVAHGRLREAARVIEATSNFPEMCGRLCPQEKLCERRCVVGRVSDPVSIGRLEEFVSRLAREQDWATPAHKHATARRVAVVGSGPAGLAAAEELVRRGHDVVVFERQRAPGGVPLYGIPSFKLAKERIAAIVERLRARGIEFRCGVDIGRDISVDALFSREGFSAVLLATGAWRSRDLSVPARNLHNIFLATEFLVSANLGDELVRPEDRVALRAGRRCVVVGGGDTATDCARTAVRLGFDDVVIVYRRSRDEMPGRAEDRAQAADEGVRYEFLLAPVRFEGREKVERVVCQAMQLEAPDPSGRRRPVPIPGSEATLAADAVILALGYEIDTALLQAAGARVAGGALEVDASGATSRPGVYAAGDVVHGADLIVTAVKSGRNAARAMDEFLRR